jgi:hypothetical protein
MPTLAEILLEQGRQMADARRQSGQNLAQTISSVGNSIAAMPEIYRQAQRQDQQNQVNDFQLQALKRNQTSQDALEAALKNPNNYKQDGSIDDGLVGQELKTKNIGAWQQWSDISARNQKNYLETQKLVAEIQGSRENTSEKQRAVAQAQQNYLGGLAYHAARSMDEKPDDPLHVRDTFLASLARAAADPVASGVSEQHAKEVLMQTAQANPSQLRQVMESFITPDVRARLDKEYADNAKASADAAKASAETANIQKFGRPTAGTPEEQYLVALTSGDTASANRVLQAIKDTAAAKKDPSASALAQQLAGLRTDEARARLEALQKKNAPLDIEPDVQTTRGGRRYIDLSAYQGDERNKAREAANASGAVGVSKDQANALQEIDNARMNQRSINDQINDLLPSDVAGRVGATVVVPLSKVFQTNEQIAAYNSWRTAAIQTLRATAGSKGLRINEAEIKQAIENDIPKLTDTVGTARQKLQNINTMLENAEKSILVRDRQSDASATTPKPGQHWGLDNNGKPIRLGVY